MADNQSNPLDEAQNKPFDATQGKQNQWPDKGQGQSPPPLGTGEGEVPLMKSPEVRDGNQVDMRTSESDIESIQKEGGGVPRSYTPPPLAQSSEKPPGVPKAGALKKDIEEKKVFQPPQIESSVVPPGTLPEVSEVSTKKRKKGLFLGLLAVIIVVGLAAAGYFFVYPFFFQATEEVVEVPAGPAPSATSEVPSVPEVPVVPVVSETPEVPVAPEMPTIPEEPTLPTIEAPEVTTITEHVSFFKTKADVSAEVTLASLGASVLRDAFEFSTAEVSLLKETVLKDSEGAFMTFGVFAGTLLPGVFTEEANKLFDLDFTMFIYTDDKGSWPGYVARLRGSAVLADAQANVSRLEGSSNLGNLFLTSPGTPTTWKSGQAEGISNRYLTYSQSGAGINYGWLGNTLVVSTSYAGFQEALKRLK